MTLKQYLGAAVAQALAAGLTNSSLSFTTSDSTGMPGGGTAPFVVVIERGTSKEEKILVDSRSGNTYTVNASGRGYDGTAAVAHNSGAPVEHGIDAITIQEANTHVNVTGNDDHTQYLNTTRHDVAGRHAFGAAYGTPSNPAAIGTAAAVGSASGPPHADHVHILGTGSISAATMFGSAIIPKTAFQAGAVPQGITVGTHAGIPAGTQGDLYLESDTHRLFLFDNAKWNYVYGGTNPTSVRAFLNTFGAGTVANNVWTKVPLDGETYDYGNNFASGTYTVPTAGQYLVEGKVELNSNNGTQTFQAAIYKNGSVYSLGGKLTLRSSGTNDPQGLNVVDLVDVAINDTIELWMFALGTGSSNACGVVTGTANTYMSVVKA